MKYSEERADITCLIYNTAYMAHNNRHVEWTNA